MMDSGFGLALRFAGGAMLGLVVWLVLSSLPPGAPQGRSPTDLKLSGQELTAKGAAVAIIQGEDVDVRQACRGGCDDLSMSGRGGAPVKLERADGQSVEAPQ